MPARLLSEQDERFIEFKAPRLRSDYTCFFVWLQIALNKFFGMRSNRPAFRLVYM
jgi:hypothetical protein